MNHTLKFVLGLALAASLLQTAPIAFAAITQKFVETPTITLYGSISSSATSMRVVPYPKDLSGNKLTMSDFGSSPTVTIDPKVKGVEEIVSFTGITDNGDNTATLTGLTRGLLSKYPYTTGGTAYAHAASAIVVFSNNPQLYARLWSPENDATSTGTLAFSSTTIPHLDAEPASWSTVNPEAFVTYAKLAAVSIAGAVNSSETVNGISQLATATQAASSTSAGSTAARLVLPASLATSSNDVAGLHVVVTQNSGKINWNLVDLGTAFTVTALATFNTGGFIDNASSTFTSTANLNGSSNFNGTATFNQGVTFNSAIAGAHITMASTTSMSGVATSSSITIAAGTLTASSTIDVYGDFQCANGGATNSCTLNFRDTNYNNYATITTTSPWANSTTLDCGFHMQILFSNSLSAEITLTQTSGSVQPTSAVVSWVCPANLSTTKSVNFANAQTLEFSETGSGTPTLNNFSIVVSK
ncbi:hypothetical protein JJE66_33735 [Bradyrhizobium diazoefficiens]|uniref:hypothetical protein n=1 Tax=Bradyrhizobium diazoefficiens TaxID=1355477 RepID=UPI00190918A1|nr:hypothetical protein [Bradyrhizobium diazoefficiens]MBK3666170.1 hypothetical protein [Bradyrhizobium diazoefficiens]